MLRPFYFSVVIWGDQFCDYLTDYCIPSLLSDNNIPALANDSKENKFLICCPISDWNKLIQHKALKKLSDYLDPTHIEIPYPDDDVSSGIHMSVGHKKITERCYQDKAYLAVLTPDLMLSDGTIKAVENYARVGKHIVYSAAIRFEQEGNFAALLELGYDPKLNPPPKIQLSGRELTAIALKNLHDEFLVWNLDSPYLSQGVPNFYKVIKDEGVLLHTLSWCPLLLDYSVLKKHDTSTFDYWTFDGNYTYRNWGDSADVYVCQDSDEMMILSWGPKDMGTNFLVTTPMTKRPRIRHIHYTTILKKVYYDPLIDPLKRRLFILPVYMHCKDIMSDEWLRQEAYFHATLYKHSQRSKKRKMFWADNIAELMVLLCFNLRCICYRKYHKMLDADRYIYNVLLRYILPAIGGNKTAIAYLKSHAKFGMLFRVLLFFR